MAELVEAPRYKPKCRWFDTLWGHRDFSATLWPWGRPEIYPGGKVVRCQLSRARLATYSTHAQNGGWHSLLSQIFLFLSPDQRPYIVKNMCTYTHTTA